MTYAPPTDGWAGLALLLVVLLLIGGTPYAYRRLKQRPRFMKAALSVLMLGACVLLIIGSIAFWILIEDFQDALAK